MPPATPSPPVEIEPERAAAVQQLLLAWFDRLGRDLPWRSTRDPYAILVSEVMLQQTQVDRVIPRWYAWLDRFPTLQALAAASRSDVIRAWQGLGYNLRAVRLHEIARQAVERFGGCLPGTLDGLLALKGIGHYTAGAVACFAYGQPVALVDTNVRRVLGRVFLGLPLAGPEQERAVVEVAEQTLPAGEAYAWNQALMDLGARICTVHRPACLVCPLATACAAAPWMSAWPEQRRQRLREARATYATAQRRQSEESRYYRGRLVDAVRALEPGETASLGELAPRVGEGAARGLGGPDLAWLAGLARKLAADGLLSLRGDLAGDPAALRVTLPE